MRPVLLSLHAHTPVVTVIEPRGLPVLSVAYHRPTADCEADARMDRHAHDAAGRQRARWDARLWADGGDAGEPNRSTRYALSGRSLGGMSVDAGWRMSLFDGAGHAREAWDGRGTHRWMDYDGQRRPQTVTEQMPGGSRGCVERFTYGGATESATNRCGRVIRHDDPAGSLHVDAEGLSGGTLVTTQRFLTGLATPDWPLALAERDALLETDAQGVPVRYATRWRYDASGTACSQTDAAGHVRQTAVDVSGRPVWVDFQPVGAAIATIVHLELDADASGRSIAVMAGNGVVTRMTWSAVDGRLQHRQASRMAHLLQDVDYACDPVGNITRIEDHAQPTVWFDGARIDPVCTYDHDTLYQLTEATGWESVQAGIGPALPDLALPGSDAGQRRRYMQRYVYDAGGNLRTLAHTASDGTQYTRTMAVAARSNRSLFQPEGAPPPDFAMGFDANGNQQGLDGGAMAWDARNQLQRVTQVARAEATDDEETYVYGGGGIRQRKQRTTVVKAVTHVSETRYLPGLELHRNTSSGEMWEVACIPAGRGMVRWMNWRAFGRKTLPLPQWRYSVDDHLGSVSLELDDKAAVISHEVFYPYGGTAWWAGRGEIEASYKTSRYGGKERDASGLYYYGLRYYAPWLCRWINPDPAGDVDGASLYAMVRNSPVTLRDDDGTIGRHAFIDALDVVGAESFEQALYRYHRQREGELRREPRDLALLDRNRNVNPPYRPGVGAFRGWERFSAITREIIRQATENKLEARGPRKTELSKLTAHAGYFVHDTKELVAGFFNLPASLAKKDTFSGVELLGNTKFKATTTDALVKSIADSYAGSGHYYASMQVIDSARAREAANPLHDDVRFTLRGHIERTTEFRGGMNARNGVPGMHAEVQAYNHARNAGLGPSEYTIYTQKLDKSITEPKDFVACYNCTSLIGPAISVYTQQGNGWPVAWHRLSNAHRKATGFPRMP